MVKKIKENPDTNTIPGRIVWLLEKLWHGSMTAMAKDIGLHPSSIGNVVHGRRAPGREILTAVGAHALVNSEWLMHGTGKPIRTDESDTVEIGLPIASRPFAGLPSQNPDALEEVLFPVSRRLHRPSRYWVRIGDGNPFTHDDQLKIAAGDMVLFEPEQERWPKALAGKPCLLAVFKEDMETLAYGRCLSSDVRCAADVAIYRQSLGDDLQEKHEYHKPPMAVQLDPHPFPTSTPVRIVALGVYRCGPC
jgi:hypothetical protein